MIKKSALAFGFFLMFFGTAQADSLTFQRIQREAAGGSAEAENKLGVYYAIGLGVTQDDYEAVTWYRLAAEQGYAEAQFNLEEMYEERNRLRRDVGYWKAECARVEEAERALIERKKELEGQLAEKRKELEKR
ncbi:MAG: sel1 repeat family protein [Chlorobiaceae bacterium]|nr:sel1 repeat family protein [Chlorobiaceae bacterium]